MNYLRKLIRVFQISNETKIIAIIRKLKITDKELADVLEETKGNTTKEDWVSAEKDFNDLGSTLNVGRQPLSSKEVADLLIPPYKNRSPASYKSNYRK